MTTLIFVHGTGVRDAQYSQTFDYIEQQCSILMPSVKVMPCSWGESYGAKFNANGLSIPLYDTARSIGEPKEEDDAIVLWAKLYEDPTYELRLLSLKEEDEESEEEEDSIFAEETLGEQLAENLRSLEISAELNQKLRDAGISEIWEEALDIIIESPDYQEMLDTVSGGLGIYRDAIARAIMAQSMILCEEQEHYGIILTDAQLRDEIVTRLAEEISDTERGVIDWGKSMLSGLALSLGTSQIKRKRGVISDEIQPMVGDILLYQGRGKNIRSFIKDKIQEAEPPVVLLAHSLGGIACVDLLVEQALDVKLLITVGSQAPLFYELNALHSLEYGKPLPEHFPDDWLNIYDLRDFLSYIGAGVFPNRVQDFPVDNKQPFPRSHSAYWTNPATWNIIKERISSISI